MQTLKFQNHKTGQRIVVKVKDKGDDWDIDVEFFPEVGKQDKESLHYVAANLVLSRLFWNVKPESVSVS